MKPRRSNQRNQAMTLVEVLVIIVVLAVLAFFYLPYYAGRQTPALRLNCVNNLHQIGLAYRIWAEENNGKYPMQVSMTNGGSMELVAKGENVWITFLVMSNELSTPKVLYCMADADRVCATNFSSDLKGKISYFVGLDANTNSPQTFLSGDDNFSIGGDQVKSGLLELSTNAPISWTAARHKFDGNIGLADGSVQQATSSDLRQSLLPQTGLTTNRLAIP